MDSENLYRRLQQHLDKMPVGFPATESGVEIRILQQLFTPDEAEVALELSAVPEPVAAIHSRICSAITREKLVRTLDAMADKGLLLRLEGTAERLYSKLIFAIGMYERQLKRLTPQLVNDTDQYFREAFDRSFHTGGTPQMRTVPVNQTIAVERRASTCDDIRAYVRSSPGPFAAMDCICRKGQDLVGKSCRQTSLRENCLTIGRAAEMMVDHRIGRLISREEMLGLLDQADKEGLVLQPENTKHPLFVCCCCGCCCGVLQSARRLPRPADYFASNYYADVDAAQCDTCGMCESRCQMDAIRYVDGAATVDVSRCIGCGLCVTTCTTGAMRLVTNTAVKTPPNSTSDLYMTMLEERYGKWGMAKIAAQKFLGRKI